MCKCDTYFCVEGICPDIPVKTVEMPRSLIGTTITYLECLGRDGATALAEELRRNYFGAETYR